MVKEEPPRPVRDERACVATERRVDTTAAANNNKVKSMATQLLAKFEENAPAQSTGLKRQVGLNLDDDLKDFRVRHFVWIQSSFF